MSFIASDNVIRFRGDRAFNEHFIIGITGGRWQRCGQKKMAGLLN